MCTCLCIHVCVCVYRMNTRSVQRALNSIMGHGAPTAEAMNNGIHGKLTNGNHNICPLTLKSFSETGF